MIRKAKVGDIKQIQELINYFAGQDLMLPRSLNILYENLRDFFVCEDKNKIVGCSALHISWDDLAEIKSLAVTRNYQNKGIGRKLAEACILEAKEIGAGRVFVLTYAPDFLRSLDLGRQTITNCRIRFGLSVLIARSFQIVERQR